MSLINDMLQDLDKRKAPERPSSAGAGTLAPANGGDNRWLKWLVGLLALVLIIVFIYPFLSDLYKGLSTRLQPSADEQSAQALLEPDMRPPISAPKMTTSEVSMLADKASKVEASKAIPVAVPAKTTKDPTLISAADLSNEEKVQEQVNRAQAGTLKRTNPEPVQALVNEVPAAADKVATPMFKKRPRTLSAGERDRKASRAALQAHRNGQSAGSIAELRAYVGQNPQGHVSRETLVVLLLAQQRVDEAAEQLSTGLDLAPERREFIKLQARIGLLQKSYTAALAAMESQLSQAQQDAEYLSLAATLYQRAERHSEAISLYRKLLASHGEQVQWWIGQGISLEALALKNDALQAYLRARRIPHIDARLKKYADARINALN